MKIWRVVEFRRIGIFRCNNLSLFVISCCCMFLQNEASSEKSDAKHGVVLCLAGEDSLLRGFDVNVDVDDAAQGDQGMDMDVILIA